MPWQPRKTGRDAFGRLMRTVMLEKGRMTDAHLAGLCTAAGHILSGSYINYLKHGKRIPSPELVDCIATVLGLDLQTRTVLHRAAAIDYGYEIGVSHERDASVLTRDGHGDGIAGV